MGKWTGTCLSSFLILCLAVAYAGCGREPSAQVRKKLDIVVESDLRAITGEIPVKSLADSVYTRVTEYKEFDKGQYRVRAMVDFYYLKGVRVKRTVKYRYVKSAGKWERYANDYIYY
jgi:hypothetical protein